MKFCQDHWDRLRARIEDRGLSHLIAPDGITAAAQIADQLERAVDRLEGGAILPARGDLDETVTPVNFDPLMSAHWAITANVMKQLGPDGMYLMGGGDEGDEDPIDFGLYANGNATRQRMEAAGVPATWSRCPLCYIGLAHELSCTETRCTLPVVDGYAWMLDRAADDAATAASELQGEG